MFITFMFAEEENEMQSLARYDTNLGTNAGSAMWILDYPKPPAPRSQGENTALLRVKVELFYSYEN